MVTVEPNHTEMVIRIYQGESRRVEGNLYLGEFRIDGIRGPAGQEVDIRFTYDLNGVLVVEATVVETSKKVCHLVTRYARGLTAQQIARAVEEMRRSRRTRARKPSTVSCSDEPSESIENCRWSAILSSPATLGRLRSGHGLVIATPSSAIAKRSRGFWTLVDQATIHWASVMTTSNSETRDLEAGDDLRAGGRTARTQPRGSPATKPRAAACAGLAKEDFVPTSESDGWRAGY